MGYLIWNRVCEKIANRSLFPNTLPFVIPSKQTKLFVANLGTLLEGTVPQIFHLRLSFHFMTKNDILCIFQQIYFRSIILLTATRDNLKTVYWILTQISAFKNIKVKIQISFSLYLYRFFINNYMTFTIEKLIYSALVRYISCHFTGINGKCIRENAQPLCTRR